MKQVKKSIKSFMQEALEENKEGILSGGFGSIKGGFKSTGLLSNPGNCDNRVACGGSNSGDCNNDYECSSTNSGDCTNEFACT